MGGRLIPESGLCTRAIDALNHPFYVIDADTYAITLSNAAARSGDPIAGCTCYGHTHHQNQPCDALGERCPLAEVRRTGQPAFVEHLHYDAQGSVRAFEVHAFPLWDAGGRLAAIVEYTLEITERKEVERLQDEFLSMVTHELRSPLHHIKGFATTLLQTDVAWDDETQRDFLDSISREADRLSDLVDKILHLSRLGTQPLPAERDCFPVAELIDAAVQRRRRLLADHPIHLEMEPDLPTLWVDGREIETVLLNLLENAAHYSPTGAPITVSARQEPGAVILSVADRGIGIPPAHQSRIFERFYRVPSAGPRPPGTGLGLAICKRIVERHGGRIWVDSEPGEGTSFFIRLPCDAGQDTDRERPASDRRCDR